MTMTFLFLGPGTCETDTKKGNDEEQFAINHVLKYKVPHLKKRSANESLLDFRRRPDNAKMHVGKI